MLTLSKGFDDKGEADESKEDDIEFIEAGEGSTEALEPAEEPLDFIALAVDGFVVLPWLQAVALGRHYRNKAEIQGQLPGLVVLLGAVHNQMQRRGQRPRARQQLMASLGVGGLTVRERKGYGRSSIRGNQMNLGGPSATGLADGLRSVFFNAPVPSGCTLTMVESRETASILMRTICSRCNFSKMLSSTPLLAQRFMRV